MTVFLQRNMFVAIRGFCTKCFVNIIPECSSVTNTFYSQKRRIFSTTKCLVGKKYSSVAMPQPAEEPEKTNFLMKKKSVYKKPAIEDLNIKEGHYLTLAYATANSYDLKALEVALRKQNIYEPIKFNTQEVDGVLIASARYNVDTEPGQILFFNEGAVVFWNCSDKEVTNVLEFVKRYEIESYPRDVVEKEKEIMSFMYQPNAKKCHMQESSFILVPNRDNMLEKYAFSHAMAQSARLGAWESRLEDLAASVRLHSKLMSSHGAANVDKKEVVRKLGELFSLRHCLNVESDILDTPDFYWEEEQLERLYVYTVNYLSIPRRTRVLNERLSHCVELLELLSTWAADRHHVRLEWMVIALILAEVCFELLHYFERYIARKEYTNTNVISDV